MADETNENEKSSTSFKPKKNVHCPTEQLIDYYLLLIEFTGMSERNKEPRIGWTKREFDSIGLP